MKGRGLKSVKGRVPGRSVWRVGGRVGAIGGRTVGELGPGTDGGRI